MSDSQRGQGQPKGLPAWTATRTAKEGARKKTRTTYSCLNCHRRKVKVSESQHTRPDCSLTGFEV